MKSKVTYPIFFRATAFVLLLLVFNTGLATTKPTTALLLSPTSPIYETVANSLIQTIPRHSVLFEKRAPGNANENLTEPDFIVSIGSEAFHSALQHYPQTPLIASFLPKRIFNEEYQKTHRLMTAIYVDQPLDRQISFIRALLPKAATISTVFGETSVFEKQDLLSAIEAQGMRLLSVVLKNTESPVSMLQQVIQDGDLFLAIPDKTAFNRASAKWSIFIALKSKKALFGFSEKYVDAGALAALYSTPEQIGKQTGEVVSDYLQSKILPTPAHPEKFSIKTNMSTARLIGISIPSHEVIIDKMAGKNP